MEDINIEKYKKFEKIIDKLDNLKDMESADSVVESILQIKKIENQLEKLNQELLSKPETAMFYIHLITMDEDEVYFSKQELSRRIKRQRKKEEKKMKKK